MGQYVDQNPVRHTPQGWPVFRYRDDSGQIREVMQLPSGELRWAEQGANSDAGPIVGAVLGGALAAIFAPEAIVLGTLLGLLFGAASKDAGPK